MKACTSTERTGSVGPAVRQASTRLAYSNPVRADGRVDWSAGSTDSSQNLRASKPQARSPGRPEAPWLHSASTGARLASGISPWGLAPLSPVPHEEIPARPRLKRFTISRWDLATRWAQGLGAFAKWMRNIPNLGTVNLTDPQTGDEPHSPPPCNHPRPAGTNLKAIRHAQRRTRC